MNLAESFYLAMPDVSWATVVVGDPLCAPFRTAAQSGGVAGPGLDPDTELPRWFSARAVATFSRSRTRTRSGVKHYLRGQARLAHGDRAGGVAELKAAVDAEGRLVEARTPLAELFREREGLRGGQHAIPRDPGGEARRRDRPEQSGVQPGRSPGQAAGGTAVRAARLHAGRPRQRRSPTRWGGSTICWATKRRPSPCWVRPRTAAIKSADIQIHAARAFLAAGRPEPARKYLDRALALQPDLAQSARKCRR